MGDAPLIFVEPLTEPSAAPNARPWLTEVSGFSRAARSQAFRSSGSAEAASITVVLENRERQASILVRVPLRVRAEVHDGTALYFAGLVQSCAYGTALVLGIEA